MDHLQAALEELAAGRGPGLFALVADAGEVVFTGSVGTADLDRPRPIEVGDRFRIASVTKPYLATVVLQLADQGRLSLTDTLDHRLPGLLPGGEALHSGRRH